MPIRNLYRREKPVSAFGHSLEILGIVRIVPQGGANLPDAGVEGLFKIDVGIVSPDRAVDIFPWDEFSRLIREQSQHECGLRLETYEGSVAGKPATIGVECKGTKSPYPVPVEARGSHMLGKFTRRA